MGQDEFLELIGLQVGDILQWDTIRRNLRLLRPLQPRERQSEAGDDDMMHRWRGDEAKVRQYLGWLEQQLEQGRLLASVLQE